MSDIYAEISGISTTDKLQFNQHLCAYCLYSGNSGVVAIIDFEHLKTMTNLQNYASKMIITFMESKGTSCFFIQKDISHINFKS
jgi:hypothetical protein